MRIIGQFSRFLVVGILNTGIDLVVLNAETLLTGAKDGTGYAVQKGISFFVAVVFSYLLNKHWTFGNVATTTPGRRFHRFFGVSVLGAVINVAVATAVVTYLQDALIPFLGPRLGADQLWVNIGALCGTGAGLLWNFTGYKKFVFMP